MPCTATLSSRIPRSASQQAMYESNQDPMTQHGIGLNAKQGQTFDLCLQIPTGISQYILTLRHFPYLTALHKQCFHIAVAGCFNLMPLQRLHAFIESSFFFLLL